LATTPQATKLKAMLTIKIHLRPHGRSSDEPLSSGPQ
jgi:hypothetical protein